MIARGNGDDRLCRAFGGAVILPREVVLTAGNWNPNLNACEEMELYGRLPALGCPVIYLSWSRQVARGLFRYRGSFDPQIAEDWNASARRSDSW